MLTFSGTGRFVSWMSIFAALCCLLDRSHAQEMVGAYRAAPVTSNFLRNGKIVEHKKVDFACNETVVFPKHGLCEECSGHLGMCLVAKCGKSSPVPAENIASLVAGELQGQLNSYMASEASNNGVSEFLLPDDDTLVEWNSMEYDFWQQQQQEELEQVNTEEDSDDNVEERSISFGGYAKFQFGCKVTYGKKKKLAAEGGGAFYKTVHCGFRGGKRGGIKKMLEEDYDDEDDSNHGWLNEHLVNADPQENSQLENENFDVNRDAK